MRKLLVGVSVLALCAGSALGAPVVPRFVDIGNQDAGVLTNQVGARPYGMSNDHGSANGPVITGCAHVASVVQAFAWTGAAGGTYTALTDATGATPGNMARAFRVSHDGTEILGGTADGAQVAKSTDGWATHATTALPLSTNGGWYMGFAEENGTYGASLAAGGAAVWASSSDPSPTTIPGLTGFSYISADGNYVVGTQATAHTYAVYDIAGNVTRALTPDAGGIESINGISHDGKWVIGTRRTGWTTSAADKATRRVQIWEWDAGTGAYKAPVLPFTTQSAAAGLSDYEGSDGIAFLFTPQTLKTKNGVSSAGHAYMAFSDQGHKVETFPGSGVYVYDGVKLTIGQSVMWLGDHIAWANLGNPLAAGQYYGWGDGFTTPSPDSYSMTGSIIQASTAERGFFVTLPEPASLLLLGLGGLFLRRRRR